MQVLKAFAFCAMLVGTPMIGIKIIVMLSRRAQKTSGSSSSTMGMNGAMETRGTYFGPLRTEGSGDATVMAMASGYGLGVYKQFVGGLRKSGFEGRIILGVKEPMNDDAKKYLMEQEKVILKFLTLVDCEYEDGSSSLEHTN